MILKDMIKVMSHYENGGEVEFKFKTLDDRNKWILSSNPSWNWGDYDYRIKEPKQKVTIEKWLIKNTYNEYYIREAEPKCLLYENKVKLIESYEIEL